MKAPASAPANGFTAEPEEPRWLTDEEQRVWRSFMEGVTLLDDHLDRQLQRDAGMPHVYYGLLVKLAEAPRRRLRMTELAMLAKITRSRLSHAIARLEKNGWVHREDCPDDKRGQFAVLTDEGLEVLRQTAPGHVEAVRQAVFDRLSPEQQKWRGARIRRGALGRRSPGGSSPASPRTRRRPAAISGGGARRHFSRPKRVRTCPGSADAGAGQVLDSVGTGRPLPRAYGGPEGVWCAAVSGRRPGSAPRPPRPRRRTPPSYRPGGRR